MKGHMFNIDNGYLEGLCRGFKNGILRQVNYSFMLFDSNCKASIVAVFFTLNCDILISALWLRIEFNEISQFIIFILAISNYTREGTPGRHEPPLCRHRASQIC